jgi:hypothetical protein
MEQLQIGTRISMGAKWKGRIPSWRIAIGLVEAFERQAIIRSKARDLMETHQECTSTAARN